MRDDILNALVLPDNIGDLHLRMLISEPESYNVDKKIVTYVIQAFYEILWDLNSKLKLDVLVGEHREFAFVEVKTNIVCNHFVLIHILGMPESKQSPID